MTRETVSIMDYYLELEDWEEGEEYFVDFTIEVEAERSTGRLPTLSDPGEAASRSIQVLSIKVEFVDGDTPEPSLAERIINRLTSNKDEAEVLFEEIWTAYEASLEDGDGSD